MQWGDAGLRHQGKKLATWPVAEGLGVGRVALCPKGQGWDFTFLLLHLKGQTGSFGAVWLHFAFFFPDLS